MRSSTCSMAGSILDCDFTQLSLDAFSKTPLKWRNPPDDDGIELLQGAGIKITPNPKTDYWLKDFRVPPAHRVSGHALLYTVPGQVNEWVFHTTFTLEGKVLYDQAGIMVFINEQVWLKSGIEYVSGEPRMSCVVTNDMSDWNYLKWHTSENVSIRASCQRYPTAVEILVEYQNKDGEWVFLREAGLRLASPDEPVQIGLMCCAPKKEKKSDAGMNVVYKNLTVTKQ